MRNVKKILAVFIVIVLVFGIGCLIKEGFNYGVEYKAVTEIKFMLGEVLNIEEVNSIVNEAFNGKEVKVQKVGYFDDSVNISVVEPTDEEIQSLIDKFNKKYNQNNDMDSLNMVKTGNITFMEIVKPYVFPVILVLVLIAIYMGIRFRNQGVVKVILIPLFATLIVEALYFSAIAILQTPITIWTMPIALGLMIVTLTLYAYKFEKNI